MSWGLLLGSSSQQAIAMWMRGFGAPGSALELEGGEKRERIVPERKGREGKEEKERKKDLISSGSTPNPGITRLNTLIEGACLERISQSTKPYEKMSILSS